LKLTCSNLPRATRVAEEREFTESSTGARIALTLRRANAADCAKANEEAQRLIEDYITGSEIREAAPFPDPEIKLSRTLFLNCATLSEMQPAEGYSALDMVFISDRMPGAWMQIQEWARSLNQAQERDPGNAPGAPGPA